MSQSLKFLALLVSLTLVRGFIYMTIFPPWLAPDEATHFEAIRLIGQEGLWPTAEVYQTTPMHPDMSASFDTFQIWQISGLAPPQGIITPGQPVGDLYKDYYPLHNGGSVVLADKYPLFYHLLLAPLAAAGKSLTIVQQVYLLRLASLFITTITVVAGWYLALTIFPNRRIYALALGLFLIFLPMHLHINTSISTDSLTTCLATLYFLMLARIFCRRASLWNIAGAGIFLGLAVLSKPTALFLIPTSAAAVMIYVARRRRWPLWRLSPLLLILLVATFIGSVLFFQVASGGRGLATLSFSDEALDLSRLFFKESPATYLDSIRWGFLSFWGLFGWANIPIPGRLAQLLWGICLLIGIGVIIFFVRHVLTVNDDQARLTYAQREMMLILGIGSLFALMGLYTPLIASSFQQWAPQSRYLFPALSPIALIAFLGFQQLIPGRWSYLALPIWLLALIVFDTLVLSYTVIPRIYG
ncbi:MAG: DUF2142 domain-containing protein [Anaerolineae bacterium]|nr:DUF2142 domain-containing protein [Anaerolineae bacterium]